MKEVLIIGFGSSGKAAAKLAKSKNYKVLVFDDCLKQIDDNLSDHICLNSIEEFSLLNDVLVIVSPGIDFRDDRFKDLKKFKIISEVQFACYWLKGKKIAVTGTNGKSTTVNLISHILNCEGIKAVSCGNFGAPLSSIVLEDKLDDYIKVVELSSFQLEHLEDVHFDVSMCMKITEDHLNRYSSFREYKDTKLNLFFKNPPADYLVLDKDVVKENPILAKRSKVTVIDGLKAEKEINLEIFDNKITKDITLDIAFEETSINYSHNRQNLLYAICACVPFEKSFLNLKNAIKTYRHLPYRLEWLATVDRDVNVINDSKSSSSDSVIKAIESFNDPLILILGGRNKNNTFLNLKEKIKAKSSKMILFGESSRFLEKVFLETLPLRRVDTLREAVDEAFNWIEQEKVLLFSPGCESFDQFLNYQERGKKFNELVKNKIMIIKNKQ